MRSCYLLSMLTFICGTLFSQSFHIDKPFIQDYSVKYNWNMEGGNFLKDIYADRNGVIQVLSNEGILKPTAGQFLYPGKLVQDMSSRPMRDKHIRAIGLYQEQFIYADDKTVFSNAWAGKLFTKHNLSEVAIIQGGDAFGFMVGNGQEIEYIKDSMIKWRDQFIDSIKGIQYDQQRKLFWILTSNEIYKFNPANLKKEALLKEKGLTCFELSENKNDLIVGTHNGYFIIDLKLGKIKGDFYRKLPCNDITSVTQIDQDLWFGSTAGAFKLRKDGKYDYYASKRWLVSNKVLTIKKGPNNSILVLSDKGLAQIHFEKMTLAEKADFYEHQVRERHIRNGFNACIAGMRDGDVTTGFFENSDNDGLWTSMYLGAEVFRYAVTRSQDALQNCRESLDAMERLYSINKIPGFPSRSFERTGYNKGDTPWRRADDPEWDWKSTTSSDEAIGHIFAFGALAELVDDADLKKRAITLIDTLMDHIVKHNWYLIDWHGEPTRWGRWAPEYTNAFPIVVGDRKITASNITAMLQTAYHFTGKKIYKEKAFELLNRYGYLENLMRPMKVINRAPDDASALGKLLSEHWNHSDDEMYFLGYWGLYRYALNDTLKSKFKDAILDHWEIERPEKEGAWNIFTSMTGVKKFDLPEAVWYLQRYPMDLINWRVVNSKRMDIEHIPQNFRGQTTKEVLPASELVISKHNANRFTLDGGDENGSYEDSAGDIWLLPYWIGRYFKVIGEPQK